MGDLLSQFGIDWRLFVAQLLNFLILLWILRRFVYPPLVKLLRERHERIERGVAEAEEASQAKVRAQAQAEVLRREAEANAQQIVADALRTAEEHRHASVLKAKEEAAAVVAEAKRRLADEGRAAVAEAEAKLADLVVAAAEQVVGATMTAPHQRKVVEAAVAKAVAELDGRNPQPR